MALCTGRSGLEQPAEIFASRARRLWCTVHACNADLLIVSGGTVRALGFVELARAKLGNPFRFGTSFDLAPPQCAPAAAIIRS
jgi:hypothetical protein